MIFYFSFLGAELQISLSKRMETMDLQLGIEEVEMGPEVDYK